MAEAGNLPVLTAEGFDDTVAGDSFMQNVLNLGQLVLTASSRVAHTRTDLARRINDAGHEQQQYPRQAAPFNDNYRSGEDEGEELLQGLRQHSGHGILHALDIVN